MDITLKKKPTFGKHDSITMELANHNRIYGRIESLQLCLASKGYNYEIDIAVGAAFKKLKLKPDPGNMKLISTCEHLEAVLEVCGFTIKIEGEV